MCQQRLVILDCTLSAESGRIFVAAVQRLLPASLQLVVHAPARQAESGWTEAFLAAPPAGLLISGSAASVGTGLAWVEQLAADLRRVARARVATLALCFGHQLLAHAWGGRVRCPATATEARGIRRVQLQQPLSPLLGREPHLEALFSHSDQVCEPPPGWRILASSDYSPIQALAAPELPLLSVQWHPEADRAMIEDNPAPDPDHSWNHLHDERLHSLGGHLVLPRFLNAIAAPARSLP
jgi:GMP synthase (glutamine-hydrolysing)